MSSLKRQMLKLAGYAKNNTANLMRSESELIAYKIREQCIWES